jgi:hypothetical protein
MLVERKVLPEDEMNKALEECRVLCRIIAASRKMACGIPKNPRT